MKNNYPEFDEDKKGTYVEQIVGDAPIGLSGEEYEMAKKMLLAEVEKDLIENDICPSCGGAIKSEAYANGPDDFENRWVCTKCGDVISD